MQGTIAVKVDARGELRDGTKTLASTTVARCDLCGQTAEAVASITADSYACKTCLRLRLEAITVALYELREPGAAGLPWGKLSG